MSELLTRARQQLASEAPHSVRRACWLARAALEQQVLDLLKARGIDADRCSERARLTCLEGAYVDQRDLTASATYAWSRLSEACHQHAYELAPTHHEASLLVDLVASLELKDVPQQAQP